MSLAYNSVISVCWSQECYKEHKYIDTILLLVEIDILLSAMCITEIFERMPL